VAPNPFAAIEIVPAVAVGTGVGGAVSGAIAPVVQQLQNDAWENYAVRPVAAGLVAAGVGEGKIAYTAAAKWAKQQGYDQPQFDAMVAVAETGPGLGQAFRLWRRDLINAAGFRRAAKRLGIEEEWLDGLEQTRQEPLDPAVLAAGIVRGLIPDPGILPVGPPSGTGKVPRFPVFNVDALEDAKWAGVDRERLSVMVGNYGRPMSPEAAAFAVFKGILDRIDFDRAIAEGDVRNEWADSIFENQRFVLSPQDAAGLRLRGWKTQAESDAIGAKHGATPETMELLYLNRGRPATVRQTVIGYRRGASLPGFVGDESGAVGRAVTESDLRPEWKGILEAAVPTYPSLFQLNRLVAAGAITADIAGEWAFKQGMAEEVVTVLKAYWSQAAAPTTQPWLNRAKTRLYTTAHAEFMDHELPDTAAVAALEFLGVPAGEANAVVTMWTYERGIFRKDLTQAQVLKFYRQTKWTRVQAYDWLTARGLSGDDADALLQ